MSGVWTSADLEKWRLLDLELVGDVAGGVVVLGSDSRATLALRAMWT